MSANTKQLIERNLPFNAKYVYLDIARGSIESGQLTYCDNCGKLITNMVHIVDKDTQKRFTIGTDCTETLSKAKCLYNNGTATDYYMDLYAYNKAARVVTELNKGAKLVTDSIFAHVVNAKGKLIECSLMDLKKYFPQYLKS